MLSISPSDDLPSDGEARVDGEPPADVRARSGPDQAWVARRALTVALRTAVGVLGDRQAAEDVAQEVAIIALRSASQLRDPDKLDAWLHRVAVRAALKEARRGAARRHAELTHGDDAAAAAGVSAAEADLGRAAALLAGLPARQRAAVALRYVHDLTDDEIASALGCRVGTVRSLLSRGRAALRVALDAEPGPRPRSRSRSRSQPPQQQQQPPRSHDEEER
ncbi:MAG TPA: RNA polymerase sigma factor [Solirubrobacteraceae bacterium]|nr:RNA polymerase sigma factor [Solirubrobacteraceae bacterium]